MSLAFSLTTILHKLDDPLVIFGLGGQFIFMLRFVVQWLASEKAGRSYIPIGFWYISVVGGLMLFVYALLNEDPVIMLGQLLGIGIYVRNLVLIYSERRRSALKGAFPLVAEAPANEPESERLLEPTVSPGSDSR